jgi:hypothetical protein
MRRRALLWLAALAFPGGASGQAPARVALFDGPGVGADALAAARAAIEAERLALAIVNADAIRRGALAEADVVLFTGGRGSHQGRALGDDGRAAVRSAVEAGLGYVGICGGAFLALQGEPAFFKLAIVAARHATGDAWMRGIGPADVVPEDGSPPVSLHYANGPLPAPEEVPGLTPPVVLAHFGTEYALPEHGTAPGEMLGRPAILSARFGRGRIVLFSPNPTLEPARPELLLRALERSARGSARSLDTFRDAVG